MIILKMICRNQLFIEILIDQKLSKSIGILYLRTNTFQRKTLRQQTKASISPLKKQDFAKLNDESSNSQQTKPNPAEFDSQSIIEDYLHTQKSTASEKELENISEAMIEKQVQAYEEEQVIIAYKLKNLKSEVLHLPRNDYKAIQINQTTQLLNDKLDLIDKVIRLFRDKQTMRIQIQNQKTLISQLTQKIISIETYFADQLHQLKIYNATLPTEKERQLEIQNYQLKQRMEKETELRGGLEKSVKMNIQTFEKLFKEAGDAKLHILEQLKEIKQKKDDLDRQLKQTEDIQQQMKFGKGLDQNLLFNKNQGQAINPTDLRHSVQGMQQLHSISSNSSKQLSTSSHLSKFINKTAQNQNDFNQKDKGSLVNVLQGLNNDKQYSQQGTPLFTTPPNENSKRVQSLATIKENDKSSPKSFTEEASLDNSSGSINKLNVSKRKI